MKSLCVIAVLTISVSVHAADPNEFTPIEFDRYGNGIENNSNDMRGAYFVPDDYDPNQSYALVVAYHGLGRTGSNSTYDGQAHITSNNFNNLLDAAKTNDFILYAPQTYAGWGVDQTDNTLNVVGELVKQYNVDTSRIYATGLSLGGGGTWTAISQYSDVFAAGVPIAGTSTINDGWAIPANMTKVPIWAFHADNDGTVNVDHTRSTLNAIRAANGDPGWDFSPGNGNTGAPYYNDGSRYYEDGSLRYTEYDTGGHGVWGRAWNEDSTLYPWMLSQTKPLDTLQEGQTVRFNTGWSSLAKGAIVDGKYWNSMSYGLGQTTGIVRAFARTDDTNTATTLMLEIVNKFGNDTGAANTGVVDEVGWAVWSSTNPAIMRVLGLIPGGEYDLEFFATAGADGTTRYTSFDESGNPVSDTLDYGNNTDTTVLLEGVFADENGALTIEVQGDAAGSFGYINWFSVTAVTIPEPGSLTLLLPVAALWIARRR